MQASTDARVRAIIAHELGHLRSHCDLGINQDDQDLAEAEANYYAKLWGHPLVNNLYKTEECDELQKFSRQLGMSWRIFCVEEVLCLDDLCGTFFTCLKPGERFLAKDSDFCDIGVDFEEVRDYMRYCSTRKAPDRGSIMINRTTRWGNQLDTPASRAIWWSMPAAAGSRPPLFVVISDAAASPATSTCPLRTTNYNLRFATSGSSSSSGTCCCCSAGRTASAWSTLRVHAGRITLPSWRR